MPLASAAAALVGGALLFWRRLVAMAGTVWRAVSRAGSSLMASLRVR